MKIKLIQIGKTIEDYLNVGINEYVKRLQFYTSLEIITIPDLKNRSKISVEQIKQQEGILILNKLQHGDVLILFDENGKNYTSVQYAKFIENQQLSSTKQIVFVIGGAYGFSNELYQLAQHKISLSAMTFSHQMVRLLCVEQIYRAFTIIKNEKYHHL